MVKKLRKYQCERCDSLFDSKREAEIHEIECNLIYLKHMRKINDSKSGQSKEKECL